MINALKRISMMMLLVSSMFTVSNCDLLGGLVDQAITDLGGSITTPTFCGDGTCNSNETQSTCSWDCGTPVTTICGNGTCEWQNGETTSTCSVDCSASVPGGYCGDLICDLVVGENNTCTSDCMTQGYCGDGLCQMEMGENSGWCNDCGTVTTCGDGICATDGSENGWCNDGPFDGTNYTICGGFCGDGICQVTESSSWCADCGTMTGYCGDGTCDPMGAEDGWCYDSYNASTALYDLCASVGYCGDGVCALDGSEDNWCYDNAGMVCQAAGYCGDGVCATNGSEDNWCYDSYNMTTGLYDICLPAAYCGDGVCNSNGTEDGWCFENGTVCASAGYCGDGVCDISGSENGWCFDFYDSATATYQVCGYVAGGNGICDAGDPVNLPSDCSVWYYASQNGIWDSFNTAAAGESFAVYAWMNAGTTYSINWDDSWSGSGLYSADVWVSVYEPGALTASVNADSGYFTTYTVTPATTGYAIIEINSAYSAGTVGLYVWP